MTSKGTGVGNTMTSMCCSKT